MEYTNQKCYLSYHDYETFVKILTKKLSVNKDLKYVYGIPKGGLPIAVHIANNLHLKYLDTLEQVIKKTIEEPGSTLIVDDLTDTGKTLSQIFTLFQSSDLCPITATLFHKPQSNIKPDFFVEETSLWVYFPWEDPNETPNREGYDNE